MGYSEKIVGKTASAGFQIGVRRTLPISPEKAWTFLTSAEGLRLWIGNVKNLAIEVGETFHSAEGIAGEWRIVKPLQQLRLKWTKPGWEKPSTLQIRLISGHPEKTTVSFHQENLDHAATREQMKLYWEDVLNEMLQKTKAN
ncbi:SRPBCC domain-containing protein [Paenibacillus sp. MMO-58]|uniref:SRPBCC domain-containing protein n=1 Tax=Paenibacillus sp. MMO-58 TaxID=3081290 RepID=UPI00301A7E47